MSTHPYPTETRESAIADYQAGMTMDAVATKYGVSSSGVWRWLHVAGVERRPAASIPRKRVCSLEDCNQPHRARGYCGLHYGRVIKGSQPRENWQPFDHTARIEDVRWMAATGEGLTGAAKRVSISTAALEGWLRKHDPATLSTLTAQDPLPLNTSRALFHGAGIRVSA